MLGEYVDNVRKVAPLVHNITNYVTVNDVANIVLACGASPIMADEIEEVEEIIDLCQGLNLNLGTLNRRKLLAMQKAGKRANATDKKVLLDPVGVGASDFRMQAVRELLQQVKVDVIKGNISEIRALANQGKSTHGVDADLKDAVTEENLTQAVNFVKAFARKMDAVIAVTGAVDLVSDAQRCYVIRNGRSEMERITGAGCQLSGLMAAYLAANHGDTLEAAAAAVCAMGAAGEIAWNHMLPEDGNATYRNRIIDAIYHMDGTCLEKMANYHCQ